MKNYYKHIHVSKEKKLYIGADAVSHAFVGKMKSTFIVRQRLKKDAQYIHKLSLKYSSLSEFDIDEKIAVYKKKIQLNKLFKKEYFEAFAVIVELGFRQTDKRAYEVQIMGALALAQGYLIEMATGEGKTLTASLAAVFLAWNEKPLHIFTSNDYLASRDCMLLQNYYERCHVSVGFIIGTTAAEERKNIYQCNIVYTTAKEVLADFLKDRMSEEENYSIDTFLINKINQKSVPNDYLVRGLDTVIVDEADSVLADDAITPLIISAKAENKILRESVSDAFKMAQTLEIEVHYKVSEKFHDVTLTEEATSVIESRIYSLDKIWHSKERREFLIKQALMARELYQRDKHYIIRDEKVIIVDEKTGRVMNERSWANGLHQAIEVKESVAVTDPTITFAKMSFQRFYRMYSHLCGMSGTLQNLEKEFWQIYNRKIIKIPTRLPSQMRILKDKIYLNDSEKIDALVKYIEEVNKKGLPILVGVTTIKDSQNLSKKLKSLNMKCTLLNALNDDIEAQIVAEAGAFKKITIATNMAGRGTDIAISDEVEKMGGLQVIITQRDKSRRVDMQFFGRCARQGQKGYAIAFLSLEDTTLKYYIDKSILKFFKENFHNPLIKSFSHLTYIFFQKRIEKDISNIRNKTLSQDLLLENSMSFIKR